VTNQQSQIVNQSRDEGNRRDGSVPIPILILVAVTVLTSAASLVVSRDMLVRDQVHTTLQAAADQAAMAGAAYLPGWPTRAVRAAEQSVELSGLGWSSTIDATVAPNRMSLRVALKCAAPVLLLRIFDDAKVSAVSMAVATPRLDRPAVFNRFVPATLMRTVTAGTTRR
jgi:hypothetical protein